MTPPDEDDALLAALGQLFRDREASAEARWPATDAALRPLDRAEADAVFAALPGAAPAAPSAGAGPGGAKILAFPARRRWLAGGIGLALAAALAVFLMSRGPSLAPLPEYQLSVAAGDQDLRGPEAPEAPEARYTPGSRVLLVARPAVDGAPVEARLYLEQGGRRRALAAPIEVSASGAVRVDLEAGASLPAQPGPGTLILLLRPAGLTTTDAALLDRADPRPAQVLRHRFRYAQERP